VKNGWLPNPDLWEISTIGGTTHDGQKLLIVVPCEDNETEDGGIDLVQQITQTAANAIPATDPQQVPGMPQLTTVRRCEADDGIRIRMPSLEVRSP
jgi:hypothetical protein